MPEFNLNIEIGNGAMQTAEDVAEALERTARQLRHLQHGEYAIFDLNGNKVGGWDMPDCRRDDDEEAAYQRLIRDAADGDPGELEEHKWLLPRDERDEA